MARPRRREPSLIPAKPAPPQDTGFLNRKIELHGITYRFQVYLPEDWRRDDGKQWPIILFLHGRGERGSEGMWQTQIGIAEAVRNHPDRWPFVIVMPQCPQDAHWTDPAMLDLAMAALDQESAEFHGDTARTYLTGLSMGGYGAWELARLHPHRWAAIAIAAGGVFWSYEPERWQEASTLPAEYARAVGPHAGLALPRQSRYRRPAARRANSCSTPSKPPAATFASGSTRASCTIAGRAPTTSRICRAGCWRTAHACQPPETLAERLLIPLHPPTIKLTAAQLDSLAGQYREPNGTA